MIEIQATNGRTRKTVRRFNTFRVFIAPLVCLAQPGGLAERN
jgi:hypothetical protein